MNRFAIVLLVLILTGCSAATDRQTDAARRSDSTMITPTTALGAASPTVGAAPSTSPAPMNCPSAPAPINGVLVVSVNGDLIALAEDGSNPQQLTMLPYTALAHDPAWSADGQTLAFTLTQATSDPNISWLQVGMICAMDRRTGEGRLLARGQAVNDSLGEVNWAPDGQSLLVNVLQPQFDANNNYVSNSLFVGRVELAANRVEPLVNAGLSPALSPDGQRLAYIAHDPTTQRTQLMVGNADGTGAKLVPGSEAFVSLAGARWSSDGQELLFTAASPTRGAAPTRTLVEILLGIGVAEAHGTPADIWIADATTLAMRQITNKGIDDPRATWSPDGRVAYTDNGTNGGGSVRLLDLKTNQEQQVAQQSNFLGITWRSR